MLVEDVFKRPYYEYLNDIIKRMVGESMTINEVIVQELKDWQNSETRRKMLVGEAYYLETTDIQKNKTQEISWKSNIKLEHGFAKKLVNQKVGYLLSKEPTLATENEAYAEQLKEIINRDLLKKLKNIGKEAINKGIGYLYVYIDEEEKLAFKKLPSEQILPFWKDAEHTEVSSFIRSYKEKVYVNKIKKTVEKVEYHHPGGIDYFILEGNKLVPDDAAGISVNYHIMINDKLFLWKRIPLLPFKYNEEEQPLIDSIKSLIDNYNLQASTNADLLADIPKIVYKLINYGGVDLAEFISDLNLYRAIKTDDGGDVGTIEANPATDANEKELDRDRKSIYEFGRGVDTSDSNLGNASGVALRYRYSDLDMDCNNLESEFHSSLEHLMWFVNEYLDMKGLGDFSNESVEFIFNRDIIISESEVITDAKNSVGILDDKTIRENHPWYTKDVEERLAEQKKLEMDQYDNYETTFKKKQGDVNGETT
ncbi:phage portal protein [Psychrobacillus sp. NEAU-3TGS]|uniref:phage portal protein n=1 Tax=Psychrobacillus sp. NEAU-3TGS TaxID=2995412 RepID=UPI0024982879|nr:phage portal protein [Psychrobacillus sp. NEAU-3TGS]MDI2588058.1 phage portal protein [Psychrobacillus sp. NEAU-3TGS]